jgi:hypothetical protein
VLNVIILKRRVIMKKFHSSKVAGLFSLSLTSVFMPKLVEISDTGVYTKEHRSLILFWLINEENVNKNKISSVQHRKGVIWDKVLIETSGGNNYVEIDKLRKKDAREIVEHINNLTD